MIRVVLADDHEVVRAGFKMILEQDAEIKVVAEAADGTQAYTIVSRERPDILLMDISMPPGQSGLVACEKIARDFPGTRIVILTMFAEPEYLFYTLRGGAAGYVLKNSTSEELLSAVHAVAGGGSYIHPKMAALLTKQLVGAGEEEDRSYQQLSNRELEILQLLAKGYTNKEISEAIGKETVSAMTVNDSRGQGSSTTRNRQIIERDLMQASEVGRLPRDEAIVLIAGANPIRDKKYRLEGHPRYGMLAKGR